MWRVGPSAASLSTFWTTGMSGIFVISVVRLPLRPERMGDTPHDAT